MLAGGGGHGSDKRSRRKVWQADILSVSAGLHVMSRAALPRPPHHDALHPLKQRAEQVLSLGLPVPGILVAPERLTGLVVVQGGRRKKGNVPGQLGGPGASI